MMRSHLDLCSGVGGFSLAARWARYETIGFCEIDPWCRRVLDKHWPGVPQHDDLWTLTGDLVREWVGVKDSDNRRPVYHADYGRERTSGGMAVQPRRDATSRSDSLGLITGGYPCQPFSVAGKRMGAEDDRHLWPAIAALVADLKPDRCLFENVGGHVTMGLDEVLSDLEEIGYTCRPVVIPACAVGAPHRRDRVWILADARRGDGAGRALDAGGNDRNGADTGWSQSAGWFDERGADVADAESIGERGADIEANALPSERDARMGVERSGSGRRGPGIDAGMGSATVGVGRNPDCAGWQEQRSAVTDEAQHAAVERGGGREALGGVGDALDGVPGWTLGPDRMNPWAGDWEADMPRVTTYEQDRTQKLKALGNAIVPQVAYEILRAWDEA